MSGPFAAEAFARPFLGTATISATTPKTAVPPATGVPEIASLRAAPQRISQDPAANPKEFPACPALSPPRPLLGLPWALPRYPP